MKEGEFYFDSSKSVGPNQVDNSNFGGSNYKQEIPKGHLSKSNFGLKQNSSVLANGSCWSSKFSDLPSQIADSESLLSPKEEGHWFFKNKEKTFALEEVDQPIKDNNYLI